jgi:hypothetical protein
MNFISKHPKGRNFHKKPIVGISFCPHSFWGKVGAGYENMKTALLQCKLQNHKYTTLLS